MLINLLPKQNIPEESTTNSGILSNNYAYAVFFDQTGPTHSVEYADRLPVSWKHFNDDDINHIINNILKATSSAIKRVPIFYGHLAYTYQTHTSSGYGILLPGGKRIFHANHKSYETEWPDLVVEYPAMRVYALKGKKLHRWEMEHISNQHQICMGSVYVDYRLDTIDKIYQHISSQLWGATWHYVKRKINLLTKIKEEVWNFEK